MAGNELSGDPLLAGVPEHEGYKVLGGVVLYEKLGQGGMGAVYKGRHLRLNVDVAVKVMAPPQGANPEQVQGFVRRFLREARTAAAVRHSDLIRVYDVDSQGAVHFLVMDYVDGESVADRLGRKGKLSEAEAVEICLGAAAGLAAAHRKGIVHRDVKPDNILIDKEGEVVVADLGLAKAYCAEDEADGPSMLTQTQAAMGTPYYMSPEQFASARDVGPAADVWSLGVTLYHLLTGELPWKDSSVFVLAKKIESDPLPDPKALCPGISAGTRRILRKALQKDTAERYADCGKMAKALRAHLGKIERPGEVTLADVQAGVTKLALVSVTPPPSRTLTLIGKSLVSAGETPPTKARARRAGAAEVVEERLKVEDLRVAAGRGEAGAEADLLASIDQDIRIAKELEDRDPKAALDRLKRVEKALAALDERRSLLAPIRWAQLRAFDNEAYAEAKGSVEKGDEGLLKGAYASATKAYEDAVEHWDEAAERRRERRAEARAHLKRTAAGVGQWIVRAMMGLMRVAVNIALRIVRVISRAADRLGEWGPYLYYAILYTLGAVVLAVVFGALAAGSGAGYAYGYGEPPEAKELVAVGALVGVIGGLVIASFAALVRLLRAGSGPWTRHALRIAVGIVAGILLAEAIPWFRYRVGGVRLCDVLRCVVVVCVAVLAASYTRPGWMASFAKTVGITLGLLAGGAAGGAALGAIVAAMGSACLAQKAGIVATAAVGLVAGAIYGALMPTSKRAGVFLGGALGMGLALGCRLGGARLLDLAVPARFDAAAACSWAVVGALFGIVAGAIGGTAVPTDDRSVARGRSFAGAYYGMVLMTAMVVLLASARARPLDDDPMVASGFCATLIGLLLALVNLRAARKKAGDATPEAHDAAPAREDADEAHGQAQARIGRGLTASRPWRIAFGLVVISAAVSTAVLASPRRGTRRRGRGSAQRRDAEARRREEDRRRDAERERAHRNAQRRREADRGRAAARGREGSASVKFESTDKRRGFLWIKVVKRNGYRFLRRSGRRSTGFRVHSERLRAGRHTIVVALYYGKRTPPQKRIPLVVKAGHTYRISCSFVKRGLVTKLVVKVYRDGRLTATY